MSIIFNSKRSELKILNSERLKLNMCDSDRSKLDLFDYSDFWARARDFQLVAVLLSLLVLVVVVPSS
jgi:hypothetical protein